MLSCQLFLGMGAIGGSRNAKPASSAYEFDKVFGVHPVEKILVEETGVSTPEEAMPLLKQFWKNKLATMSEEEIEELKVNHLFKPKFEALERQFPSLK